MEQYLYKIKNKNRNIETLGRYGFSLVLPTEEDSDATLGETIYAKSVKFKPDTPVGVWMIKELEGIYQKGSDEWRDELRKNGLEFTEDGYLKMNDKFEEELKGQLCVFATGKDTGVLFLNLDSVEFYSCITLSGTLPEEIKELEDAKIIYKKEFKEKKNEGHKSTKEKN